MEESNRTKVRIAWIEKNSYTNGPGPHFVVWFQGCSIHCPHCFNPHTHDPSAGKLLEVSAIVDKIIKVYKKCEVKGVTITGGEPFDQPLALLELTSRVKSSTDLGIILLSGYSSETLFKASLSQEIISYTDLLIAGPFIFEQTIKRGLRGSSNKTYHFITDYYKKEDFNAIPALEIAFNEEGDVILSGIDPFILEPEGSK